MELTELCSEWSTQGPEHTSSSGSVGQDHPSPQKHTGLALSFHLTLISQPPAVKGSPGSCSGQ